MLTEELQERIDIIKHKLKFIEQKPIVACIEQLNPLALASNQIPELISIAGGAAILTEAGKPSIDAEWSDIQLINPDIIMVRLRGYPVEQTMKQIDQLLQLPGFGDLKAVKNNRLYLVDGSEYFDSSDTGTVDLVELLAEIINPKQFIFGYEGAGWIKFGV